MADADRKKAFRAKLIQRQQQSRIDSPFVRYNELDKPVCRVCDVVLKSESDWQAHQVSRKHNQAINKLKASASKNNAANSTKSVTASELPTNRGNVSHKLSGDKPTTSLDVKKSQQSSGLPADFFEDKEAKRQKVGTAQAEPVAANTGALSSKPSSASQTYLSRTAENVVSGLGIKQTKEAPGSETKQTKEAPGSETKQTKEALPAGFFDNKEADLRARGIEIVKPDIKDEYKEFEKLIQEDLVEVDNRLEEEEVDAAEQIEEEEVVEQRTYRDRVEELKRKKRELLAAKSSRAGRTSEPPASKPNQKDDSSSDDEEDESFTVDWRAQHL